MIVAMDLNALPEEEEETYDRHVHVQEYTALGDRQESALDIANRVTINFIPFVVESPYLSTLPSM